MNTNGFLAPALGVYLWHSIWRAKYPMDPEPWHTQPSGKARNWSPPGDSATERYCRQLDNMQWKLPREYVVAELRRFVYPNGDASGSHDRIAAVRQIFNTFKPGARRFSDVPEQHQLAVLQQIWGLQS